MPSNRSTFRVWGSGYRDGTRRHLQDALEEIALAAGEAAPIGEDVERQPLPIKLLHRVRSLQSAVREPDLASLQDGAEQMRDPTNLWFTLTLT